MKSRMLIIGDDLTGAAEIGGIAFHSGYSVRILFELKDLAKYKEDVIVLDTHTRGMKPEKAEKKLKSLLKDVDFSVFNLIYKKVDSVLRGSIATEITALLDFSKKKSALIVPANPSKYRIIHHGKYYINRCPLHKTNFRFDPQYPRLTDEVSELISDASPDDIRTSASPENFSARIVIPDIPSVHALQELFTNYNVDEYLLAGASDFFQELLSLKFKAFPQKEYEFLPGKYNLFMIGSNSAHSRKMLFFLSGLNYTIYRLPVRAIDDEGVFGKWIEKVIKSVELRENIVFSGPYRFIRDATRISMITERLIQTISLLLEKMPADSLLLLEGGETASGFFRAMEWNDLHITEVIETGIVAIKSSPGSIRVVIKPGSYQWPDAVTKVLEETKGHTND